MKNTNTVQNCTANPVLKFTIQYLLWFTFEDSAVRSYYTLHTRQGRPYSWPAQDGRKDSCSCCKSKTRL